MMSPLSDLSHRSDPVVRLSFTQFIKRPPSPPQVYVFSSPPDSFDALGCLRRPLALSKLISTALFQTPPLPNLIGILGFGLKFGSIFCCCPASLDLVLVDQLHLVLELILDQATNSVLI